ncbi:MAG: serine O-acetyltransferase [Chloroflexi bacterium]|nr:serine O-acetyltransferase [Chloroflexota bacterium]
MGRLFESLRRDVRAARERDPAARSGLEVVLAYPGFHARQIHRLAHALHRQGVPLVPRLVSHLNRALTGIEIHPGARIGEGLFIDHGMGVVIGETAEIGDDVTIYQGVTLGGTSRRRRKRHPTLRDGVIVGAHAQLIGAIEIGEGARVGAGSVVVGSVPPYSTVVGVPGRTVGVRFPDDRPIARLPDPEAETIGLLQDRVGDLEARLADLERARERSGRGVGGRL